MKNRFTGKFASVCSAGCVVALAGSRVRDCRAADLPVGDASLSESRGALPARVHVCEDYETEIERRWWLRGIPVTEKKELAPGDSTSVPNTRACRAAETKDFDDKQGDPLKSWKAVIFNPVPGPPMGPNTRLNFRYRLTGTDTLRVQIYSLTNGYHRRHFLTKLPAGMWQRADVDMSQLRRPDGSGGPLAADERIDDIQFYVTPVADLLIDDVVLYDAAPGEKAPFPRRIIFTGWFDTGKQGAEWPGDFEIVPHGPPLTWKCAKSIPDSVTGAPKIRVHLRGLRALSATNRLRFRCKLSGGGPLTVTLGNSKAGREWAVAPLDVPGGQWLEKSVDFSSETSGALADELRFLAPAGSELLVDDVLLFEP